MFRRLLSGVLALSLLGNPPGAQAASAPTINPARFPPASYHFSTEAFGARAIFARIRDKDIAGIPVQYLGFLTGRRFSWMRGPAPAGESSPAIFSRTGTINFALNILEQPPQGDKALLRAGFDKGIQWLKEAQRLESSTDSPEREIIWRLTELLADLPGGPDAWLSWDAGTFAKQDPKDPEYSNRLAAAIIDKNGKKRVALNPAKADTFRKLMDDPAGGLHMALLLIHEFSELILEDPARNPHSLKIDPDEEWVEPYMLELEHTLWQIAYKKEFFDQEATPEGAHSPDWGSFSLFVDSRGAGLTHYLDRDHALHYLNIMKSPARYPRDKNREWASPTLRQSREGLLWRLQSSGSPGPSRRFSPAQAPPVSRAQALFQKPTLQGLFNWAEFRYTELDRNRIRIAPANESEFSYILRATEHLVEAYAEAGLGNPPDDALITMLLHALPEKTIDNYYASHPQDRKPIALFKDMQILIHNNYDPPDDKELKGSRNLLNHQEMLVKLSHGVDAWLLALAQRLSILETTTNPEVLFKVRREIEDGYARVPERINAPRFTSWILNRVFLYSERDPSTPAKQSLTFSMILKHVKGATGLTSLQLYVYAARQEIRIRRALDKAQIPYDAVGSRVKGPYAIFEKLRLKPEDYSEVADIRDLVGFHVVLPDGSPHAQAVTLEIQSILAGSTGKAAKDIEWKYMPDYTALHFSPEVAPAEKHFYVEVQIYQKTDYHQYMEGPFSAHWAYKTRQRTGQRTNHAVLQDLEINDFHGNFEKLRRSVQDHVYYDVATSEHPTTSVQTHRTPRWSTKKYPQKGSIADAAAMLLSEDVFYHTRGARRYQSERDPVTGTVSMKDERLDALERPLEEGYTYLFKTQKEALTATKMAEIRNTNLSEPRTLVLLSPGQAGNGQKEGVLILLERIKLKTGLTFSGKVRNDYGEQEKMARTIIADLFREDPGLFRFNTPAQLLAFLGLNPSSLEDNEKIPKETSALLWKEIDATLLKKGRRLFLEITRINANHAALKNHAAELASSLGMRLNKKANDSQVVETILYALGSNQISDAEFKIRWGQINGNGKAARTSRLTGSEWRRSRWIATGVGFFMGLFEALSIGNAAPLMMGVALLGAWIGYGFSAWRAARVHEEGHIKEAERRGYANVRAERSADGGWTIYGLDPATGIDGPVKNDFVRYAGPRASRRMIGRDAFIGAALLSLVLAGVLPAESVANHAMALAGLYFGAASAAHALSSYADHINGRALDDTAIEELKPSATLKSFEKGKITIRTPRDPGGVLSAVLNILSAQETLSDISIRSVDNQFQIELTIGSGRRSQDKLKREVKAALKKQTEPMIPGGRERLVTFRTTTSSDMTAFLDTLQDPKAYIVALHPMAEEKSIGGETLYRARLRFPDENIDIPRPTLWETETPLVYTDFALPEDKQAPNKLEFQFISNPDQAGTLDGVLRALNQAGWVARGNFRARSTESGGITTIQTQPRTGTAESPQQVLDRLRSLEFIQSSELPKEQRRRLWLNFDLRNEPGGFLKSVEAIRILGGNLLTSDSPPFTADQAFGIVEMEAEFPRSISISEIEEALSALKTPEGHPWIQGLEVASVLFSDETAASLDYQLAKRRKEIDSEWKQKDDPLWNTNSLPFPTKENVDGFVVKNLIETLSIAAFAHDGVMRKSGKMFYEMHLIEIAHRMLQRGVRNHLAILAALLHDASEDIAKNRRKALVRAGLPIPEDLDNQCIEELYQAIKNNVKGFPRKLIRDLGHLTLRGHYEDYIKVLTERDLDYEIAIKLWDQWQNYQTVHDVKEKGADPKAFASRILARGVRHILPLVMIPGGFTEETADMHRHSRQDFLEQLTLQAAQLDHLEAYVEYDKKAKKFTEDSAAVNPGLLKGIDQFLPWMEDPDNAVYFATSAPENVQHLRLLLQDLKKRLLLETFTPLPTAFPRVAGVEGVASLLHYALTFFRESMHENLARIMRMDVLQWHVSKDGTEGFVVAIADNFTQAALFLLADPLMLFALALATTACGSFLGHGVSAEILRWIAGSLTMIGSGAATLGSTSDWLNLRLLWKLRLVAFPRLVVGHSGSDKMSIKKTWALNDIAFYRQMVTTLKPAPSNKITNLHYQNSHLSLQLLTGQAIRWALDPGIVPEVFSYHFSWCEVLIALGISANGAHELVVWHVTPNLEPNAKIWTTLLKKLFAGLKDIHVLLSYRSGRISIDVNTLKQAASIQSAQTIVRANDEVADVWTDGVQVHLKIFKKNDPLKSSLISKQLGQAV